jgi:hypothetical protein
MFGDHQEHLAMHKGRVQEYRSAIHRCGSAKKAVRKRFFRRSLAVRFGTLLITWGTRLKERD